jgi:hypothetical protein
VQLNTPKIAWNFLLRKKQSHLIFLASIYSIHILFFVSNTEWEDNIKMDLQEVGGGHGDWMMLAQDRNRWWALVGKVRNFRVP